MSKLTLPKNTDPGQLPGHGRTRSFGERIRGFAGVKSASVDDDGFVEMARSVMSNEEVTATLLPFEVAFGIFITSSICDKCTKKAANLHCNKCNVYLCFDCFPIYHKEKGIKEDHTLISSKVNVSYEKRKNRGIKCLEHGIDVEFYCIETQKLLCALCQGNSKDHHIQPIEKAFPCIDKVLDNKITLNKKKIALFKNRNLKLQSMVETLQKELVLNAEYMKSLEESNFKQSNPIRSWKEITEVESMLEEQFSKEDLNLTTSFTKMKVICKENPFAKQPPSPLK